MRRSAKAEQLDDWSFPLHTTAASTWRDVATFSEEGWLPHLPPVPTATVSVLAIAVSFLEIPRQSPPLLTDQDGREENWIQSCKTSSFDHDIHSIKRVNAEPLTFEDRACYGRNRSESL